VTYLISAMINSQETMTAAADIPPFCSTRRLLTSHGAGAVGGNTRLQPNQKGSQVHFVNHRKFQPVITGIRFLSYFHPRRFYLRHCIPFTMHECDTGSPTVHFIKVPSTQNRFCNVHHAWGPACRTIRDMT
jgi:hypothetical protein